MDKNLSYSLDQIHYYTKKFGDGAAGADSSKTETSQFKEIYLQMERDLHSRESSPEWKVNNMEYDLRTTDWILEKVRESKIYAQHLYAAMCNNEFQKLDVIPILTNQTWGASWRHAGAIVAHMRQEGDYINWYCSGISHGYDDITQSEWNNYTEEQQIAYKEQQAWVAEATVTDEIREDLKKLGWRVIDE